MKKTILLFASAVLLLGLGSCSSEKELVHVTMPDNSLVFTPAAGGAVLHYVIPADPDIVGIHVRYNDAYGKPMLRTGSVLSDSLTIVGFNEAQQNVSADVTLQLRNGDETAPIPVTFSTLDSNPVTFIKSVKVESGWNGFSMNYKAPMDARGMYDVFYLGTNPYTNKPDTILLDQKAITPGGDTIVYKPQQVQDKSTILVKVEDYRGYIVGERSFDVEAMQTMKHDGIKISYANSYESDDQKVGLQYLTDGDTNGWRWFESKDAAKSYTFVSNRGAYGEDTEPMYIDIGEQTPVASVRFYAYRFKGKERVPHGTGTVNPPCWNSICRVDGDVVAHLIGSAYYTRLPRKVVVYGCRESGTSTDYAHMKWEKIGTLDQPDYAKTLDNFTYTTLSTDDCWFAGCSGFFYSSKFQQMTAEEVKALTPLYEEVDFMAAGQGEGYRYLKLQFEGYYADAPDGQSIANYTNDNMKVMSFNELEVYTKKK